MTSIGWWSFLAKKRAEIADLSRAVAAPDLWDDPDNAQKVTSRLSALNAGTRSRDLVALPAR